MTFVVVDAAGVEKLATDLAKTRKGALPFAARALVNDLAFKAREEYQLRMKSQMTLRAPFTLRSVGVNRARGLKIDRMEATMGSLADYMPDQEFGATHKKKGLHGEPIPAAAPGARKKRKRRVPRSLQFTGIKLMPRIRGSRSRQVGAAFAMARKRGGKQFAFIQLRGGRKGIFQINPSSKRRGMRKVWDLSKPAVRIPQNPMMEPAVREAMRFQTQLWRKALLFQLRRHRVFGY